MPRAGLRGLAALPWRTRTTRQPPRLPDQAQPARPQLHDPDAEPRLGRRPHLHRTGVGWLNLATMLDLFTRKIFGWSMRPTLHVEVALDIVQMAIARRRPA